MWLRRRSRRLNHDVNNENLRTLRASLLFKPIERAVDRALVHVPGAHAGRAQSDRQPAAAPWRIISPTIFPSRSRIGSISRAVNVQYHFGFADLTSTTSKWNRDENLAAGRDRGDRDRFGGADLSRRRRHRTHDPRRRSKTISRTSGARKFASLPRAIRPLQVAGRLLLSGLHLVLEPVRVHPAHAVPALDFQ